MPKIDTETNNGHRLVVHPVLATCFPVVWLYAENMGEASLVSAGRALAASVALASILWILLGIELKQRSGRGVLFTALILPMLMYGHVHSDTRAVHEILGISPLLYKRLEIVGWVLASIGLYVLYRKVRIGGGFPRTTKFLNIAFVSLLTVAIVHGGVTLVSNSSAQPSETGTLIESVSDPMSSPPEGVKKPKI